MFPKFYTYEDPHKQTVSFRGYVREYTNSPVVIQHSCGIVRHSRYEAMKDAEKLAKKLKHEKETHIQLNQRPAEQSGCAHVVA